MPMTDGNPEPKQEIVARVDSMQVAQLVHELQKKSQPEPESRFKQKINSIVAGGGIDQENLSTVTGLIQTALEDHEERLRKGANLNGAQSTQSRYADAVSDAIEKYTEGDEALEKMADHLHGQAMKKLASDSSVIAKFNQGQLDKRQVNAAAKEVVENFSKDILKRDKSSKGPTINQTIPGGLGSKALENSTTAGSINTSREAIDQAIPETPRKEAYYKLNAMFLRNRIPKEEAHNRAMAMATKQFKRGGSSA
jgi:hypothetical protein